MGVDRLYTPWRFAYVTGQVREEGCVFCNRLACSDAEEFVLHRGRHWFIILNLFPYNNGHLLLVLNRHQSSLLDCTPAELAEMGDLLWLMEGALRRAMNPDGINCGYNGGASAGAGIPRHLHLHMLPRWQGDTSFMTTVGETRIVPQSLAETYTQLRPHVQALVRELGRDTPGP
jgi:ATP adenylyltransferase